MHKKDLFTKTQQRIMFACVGIVLTCLILFSGITLITYQSRVYNLVDQQLGTYKNTILTTPHLVKELDGEEVVVLPPPFTPNIMSFVWEENVLIAQSNNTTLMEGSYPSFPDRRVDTYLNLNIGGSHHRSITFISETFSIQLMIPIETEVNSIRELLFSLIISLVILVGISLILARYLAFLVIKPVKKAYIQQVYFVQDASHEMRTPLAVIKGTLEVITKRLEEPIENHLDELSQVMSEIRGLEKMNSDLLFLSKEDLQTSLQIETFDVDEFIEEQKDFYEALAEFQNKTLEIKNLPQSILVSWDKGKVKRCFTILLENALRYTSEGDRICIILAANDKWIEISVEDTGIGIREEDIDRLFDRFFRSNDVRAKGIDGSGIGLSLLQSLCRTTGSKIEVISTYGEGSKFTLKLPHHMK